MTKVTIDGQWEQTGDPLGSGIMLSLCLMVGKRTRRANGTHYPMDNGSTWYQSINPFHCKTDGKQEIKRIPTHGGSLKRQGKSSNASSSGLGKYSVANLLAENGLEIAQCVT